MFYLKLYLLLSISLVCYSQLAEEDRVLNLPHYPSIPQNIQIYSGYLNIQQSGTKIHYMFITSEKNPVQDPVILWFNGAGPGCSSLYSFFKGIGPYVIEDGATNFSKNKFNWNQQANLLFIENQFDAGFSFSSQTNSQNQQNTFDDKTTAIQNYQALQEFFNLFPQYRSNQLFIGGESYSGISVPYLAEYIIKKSLFEKIGKQINLKGIVIGNGKIDPSIEQQAYYEFLWGRQFYSFELRDTFKSTCKVNWNSPECEYFKNEINSIVSAINPFNIYGECHDNNYNNLQATQCLDTDQLEKFLNLQEVQNGLNIQKKFNSQWKYYNQDILYKFKQNSEGSIHIYSDLLIAGIKILFYSGDADSVVPFNQANLWIPKIGLEPIDEWKQWKVQYQVAGFVTKYKLPLTDTDFIFATVKGAGQMAAQWKRKETYTLVHEFIHNQDI